MNEAHEAMDTFMHQLQDAVCDLYFKLEMKIESIDVIDVFHVFDHLLGRTSTWDDLNASERLKVLQDHSNPTIKVVTRSLIRRGHLESRKLIDNLLRTKNPRGRISFERKDTVKIMIHYLTSQPTRLDTTKSIDSIDVIESIDAIEQSPLWVMTQKELFTIDDIVDAIHRFDLDRKDHHCGARELIYLAIRMGGPRIRNRSTVVASLDDAEVAKRVNLELQCHHCWRKKLANRIADITHLPLDLARMVIDYLI